jgi:hypothetical protein
MPVGRREFEEAEKNIAACSQEMVCAGALAILSGMRDAFPRGSHAVKCRRECLRVNRRPIFARFGNRRVAHRPVQQGARFSRKDEMPSCAS